MRNSGPGGDDGGVRLDWPGRPDGDLPPVPVAPPPLTVAERWPGGPDGAQSLLIAGDAVPVLDAWRGGNPVLDAQGPVRLIYLDPPFATGSTFTADIPIGERGPAQRTLRLPAYRDAWPGGLAGYLTFMAGLLARLRDVLADDGWLCLHCDHRTSAHLRLLLDELFGPDGFRNEIVWSYGLGNGTSRRGFPRKHDTLLLYAKSDAAVFTPIRGAVSPAMANKYRHVRPDGTRFMRSYGREYDLKGGKPVGSVWEIPSVAPTSGERTGYPTQKPRALLERLISATTAPGDTVLDPCCGSGTTLIAASGLGRRAVGIDAAWLAIATARARLVTAGGLVTFVDARPRAHVLQAGTSSRPAGPSPSVGPGESAIPDGQPLGGDPAGPRRRYGLRARAWRTAGVGPDGATGNLSIAIHGLAVTAPDPVTPPSSALGVVDGQLIRHGPTPTPLTAHWSDWLTGWAVHVGGDRGPAEEPFVAIASSHRTGRSRSLAKTLAVPVSWSDGDQWPNTVAVRLYDIFGATSDHVIPVDTA